MNFLFPPRLSRSAAPLSTTLLSIFGLRFTRHQILLVSLILLVRSLLPLLQLPLSPALQSYISTLLYSTIHTSLALAATANIFDFGGVLGVLTKRFFGGGENGFVNIYGSLVIIIAQFVTFLEAVVLVYEMMRIAKRWEARMWEAHAQGSNLLQRLLIFLSVLNLAGVSTILAFLWTANGELGKHLVGFASALVVVVMTTACVSDKSNVVEGSMISLYICMQLFLGCWEELYIPTWFVQDNYGKLASLWKTQAFIIDFRTQEFRAGVFVLTTALHFIALARAKRFARLVTVGYEKMIEEEQSASTGSQAPPQAPPPAGGDQLLEFRRGQEVSCVIGVLSLIAMTFRVLVWGELIAGGEYMPLPMRCVQAVSVVGLYGVYLKA